MTAAAKADACTSGTVYSSAAVDQPFHVTDFLKTNADLQPPDFEAIHAPRRSEE